MRVVFVLSRLNYRAAVVVSLFPQCDVFFSVKEVCFAYFVAGYKLGAAEGICAVVVIVDEVTFGTCEFVVGAVWAQDCVLSPSTWCESSVIVSEVGLFVFFCEEGFAHWV